jgi:DNA mismatch repair protein MutL
LRELAAIPLDHESTVAIEHEGVLARAFDHVAARLACHASVRSGKVMTSEEVLSLFREMDEAAIASACPHGRPVSIFLPRSRIEQLFART